MTYVGDWQWLPGALTDEQASQVGPPRSVERVSYLMAVGSRFLLERSQFDLDVFEVLAEEPELLTKAWFGDTVFDCPRWADVPAMAEERLEPTGYRLADGARWQDEGDRWVVLVVAKGRA